MRGATLARWYQPGTIKPLPMILRHFWISQTQMLNVWQRIQLLCCSKDFARGVMIVKRLKSLKTSLSHATDRRQKPQEFQRLVAFLSITEELMSPTRKRKKLFSVRSLKKNRPRLKQGWATALSKATKSLSCIIALLRPIQRKSIRMQSHKRSKRLVISWCLFIASDNRPSCKMTCPRKEAIHDLGQRLGAKVALLSLPPKAYKIHWNLARSLKIRTAIRWSLGISNGKRLRRGTKMLIVI